MTSQFLKKGYPPLLFEAKKSAAYRSFLAKAVNNPKGQNNIMKYFYKNYKSSFNKFWKPIIEKRITEKISEKINK